MVGGGVSLLEVDGVIGSFFVILDLREDGKKISFLRSEQERVGGVVVVFWVSLDCWVEPVLTEGGDFVISLGSVIITPSDGYNSLTP